MLEAHYHKSKDGYYGGRPSTNALKLMDGGLLQDYLNEAGPQVRHVLHSFLFVFMYLGPGGGGLY